MVLKMESSIGWLRILGRLLGETKDMSRLLEVRAQMMLEFAEFPCSHHFLAFKSTFHKRKGVNE
jgi:hypothetical protein